MCFLKVLLALTFCFGRLFHGFTTLLVKKYFQHRIFYRGLGIRTSRQNYQTYFAPPGAIFPTTFVVPQVRGFLDQNCKTTVWMSCFNESSFYNSYFPGHFIRYIQTVIFSYFSHRSANKLIKILQTVQSSMH